MKMVCQIINHLDGSRTEEFVLSMDDLVDKLLESADKAEIQGNLSEFEKHYVLIIGTYEDEEGFKICRAPLVSVKVYLESVNPGSGIGSSSSPEQEVVLTTEEQTEIDFEDLKNE